LIKSAEIATILIILAVVQCQGLNYQSSTPQYFFQLDNEGKYTKSFLACANQTVDWASLPMDKFQGLM